MIRGVERCILWGYEQRCSVISDNRETSDAVVCEGVMMKVLVFGTGNFAWEILQEVEQKYDIVAFLDNQVKKQNTFVGREKKYQVINPNDLGTVQFEKVIIASINYASEMFTQLLELGVREHDIVVDYVSVSQSVYVYDFLLMQLNRYNEENRLDIAVKYLAIENYYGENDCGFVLYREMQQKRLKISAEEAEVLSVKFKTLIDSFKRYGFREDSYIICDEKMRIMDGAHRVALCLYFHVPFVQIKIVPRTFECDYGIEWFWEKGFTRDAIHKIQFRYSLFQEQKQESILAILWPPISGYFEEITKDLSELAEIQEVIDREYPDFLQFQNIVRGVYSVDDIEAWKIEMKLKYMSGYQPKIRILKLKLQTPFYRLKVSTHLPLSVRVEGIKKAMRTRYEKKVSPYFYDIILHIADNYFQSRVIDKIFNLDLNISACFKQIESEKYVLIKMDVPYMTSNFPDTYPIHRDADILCEPSAFEIIKYKVLEFCNVYAARQGISVKTVFDDRADHVRVRLEYLGRLLYQFDISSRLPNISRRFIADVIAEREQKNGYYRTRQPYETIIRLNEVMMHPEKMHHWEYLKKVELDENMIRKYMLYNAATIERILQEIWNKELA